MYPKALKTSPYPPSPSGYILEISTDAFGEGLEEYLLYAAPAGFSLKETWLLLCWSLGLRTASVLNTGQGLAISTAVGDISLPLVSCDLTENKSSNSVRVCCPSHHREMVELRGLVTTPTDPCGSVSPVVILFLLSVMGITCSYLDSEVWPCVICVNTGFPSITASLPH